MLQAIFENPIVAFVILVGLVVFFHELGHFLVGRALGVDVEEFSIGFGPKAFGFRRGRTEYKVCWLPLGGYVRFYGAEIGGEVPPEKRERSILTTRLHRRALISAAGPFANFLLSFLIMIVLHAVGMPQASSRVAVIPGRSAAEAGMQSGDRILEIAGREVRSWEDLTTQVSKRPGETLAVLVERPGESEPVELQVLAEAQESESAFGDVVEVGRIGVTQFFPSTQFVVIKEGLAAAMGLETGERIVAVNGRKIVHQHEWFEALESQWGVKGPDALAEAVQRNAAHPGSGGLLDTPLKLQLEKAGSQEREHVVRAGDLEAWAQRRLEQLSLAELDQEMAPSQRWESVFLPTDLLISEVRSDEDLAESVTQAWESCGVGPGVAFRGAPGFGIFSSPVDLSIFLRQKSESLLELGEEYVLGSAPKTLPTTLQIVGKDGELRLTTCAMPVAERRDHLNRTRPQIVFPFSFATSGQPLEQVVLKSTGLFGAVQDAGDSVLKQAGTIFVGLKKLVSGSIPLANLGGPIQIARVAGSAAEGGLLIFFLTVSWMSVNIGMFNLLPLPALDGGALLMQGVEAAYGRPLPLSVQHLVQRVGVLLILMLIVLVFYNDILRLLGS